VEITQSYSNGLKWIFLVSKKRFFVKRHLQGKQGGQGRGGKEEGKKEESRRVQEMGGNPQQILLSTSKKSAVYLFALIDLFWSLIFDCPLARHTHTTHTHATPVKQK
jgi:hypothetical protein